MRDCPSVHATLFTLLFILHDHVVERLVVCVGVLGNDDLSIRSGLYACVCRNAGNGGQKRKSKSKDHSRKWGVES